MTLIICRCRRYWQSSCTCAWKHRTTPIFIVRDMMSRNQHDLLNSANVYRRTDAGSKPDEPLPGPREFNLPSHTRTNSERYASSDFNESEELNSNSPRASSTFSQSFNVSSDFASSEGYGDTSDLPVVDIAEGQRLVIAIDYGTTFTGTRPSKSATETETDT